ncbi:LysR family transcriptional regulator [Novosphingobium mangrovi (ex Hu et al. 2023)]|uniref:LysR family transcriptional regulator n=1 Tax=Novosphingobium mangrovi (ex Hu et al. 2023) TaxID=2930094 RepID=A0ABT0A930_9SPHN|nr:LysR family transcriptional regulator [Novosphingobium mangrovi (ex Hu et al. 2023)]MCJ1959692.1 LysR family transcriptional regulator [Novosphingobium mangrovi (ex Hu et al. 2023)]
MSGAWDGIEEFVSVARAGSFTGAARSFGASVTHMSRSVSRLEARLGSQLFHRTTRSLSLTEAGRHFFETGSRLIAERDDAIAAMTASSSPRGHLRITCSYTLGEQFIGPILRGYAQEYPEIAITCDLDNDVVDLIRDGYDLAIRTGHLEDSRLVATRVASRAMVTVASPGYLAEHGVPLRIGDLKGHACLMGSNSLWQFARGETFRPEGRWKANSGIMVLEAALEGMGLCQLPRFYAAPHLRTGALREVLSAECPEDEPIWAVYPRPKHLSPKVSTLVERLRAELQGRLSGEDIPATALTG